MHTLLLSLVLALLLSSHLCFKFGSNGPFIDIEQATDVPTKRFFDEYVKEKRALLIRNATSRFPAFSRWQTDEYFRNEADETKLVVETTKKESRSQEILQLSMNEFLDAYQSREVYLVNSVPLYLRKDVVLPQPLQCAQAIDTLDETMMWFSSGGTKSVVHTDDYENILCQFVGVKEVILVDYNKHKKSVHSIIDEPRGSFSRIDVDNVDIESYPAVKDIEYYKFNLTAGDCIYIPFRWLHQIRSYDRNIAVNFWFNYEKIFGRDAFGTECEANELDLDLTLDKLNYSTNHALGLKYFIARQVNSGSRRLEQWQSVFLQELNNADSSQLNDKISELIKELFDYVDYNADGILSDDEVIDLDENSLEQMYSILNEIDLVIDEHEQRTPPEHTEL